MGSSTSNATSTVVLVVGAVVGTVVLAFVVFVGWFLPAFGRGEFMTADFDVEEARAYVEEVRSGNGDWDRVGTVVRLPAQYTDLSVGGEVLIWADRDDGALSIQFWARRGIQSSDVYVFVEEGGDLGCAEQTSITEIDPHWYFVRNCQ